METKSFLPEHSNNKEEPMKVSDLIQALENFKEKHGDTARVVFFFITKENEIEPFQLKDVRDGFYDYVRGDVCNIELIQ